MKYWLKVRDQLPASSWIEVEQRDIALKPGLTGRRVGEFLEFDEQQIQAIQEIFEHQRPEQTGDEESDRALTLEDTGWTEEQKAVFLERCGPLHPAYGYSLTSSYYLENSETEGSSQETPPDERIPSW